MSTTTEVTVEKLSKRKSSKKQPALGAPSDPEISQSASSTPSKKRKRDEKDIDAVSAVKPEQVEQVSKDVPLDPSEPPDVDATVLSHAKARKERKMKKQKPGHSSTSPDADRPTKSAKSSEPSSSNANSATKKRQNSIWVGNLSFKTTTQQLEQFFQFAGAITRVNLPMKGAEGGKSVNRGFAYVDFATPEGKAEAITYSERNLDGRRLLIKDGNDFNGRPALDPALVATVTGVAAPATDPSDPSSSKSTPGLSHFAQKILRKQKQPPAPTLFVGNLSFEATETTIRAMIEAHEEYREKKAKQKSKKALPKAKADSDESDESDNEDEEKKGKDGQDVKKVSSLAKVRVGQFEDSGNCKGFAFLDFRTTQEATAALLDPRNHMMDGRELKLEFAGPDAVRRSGLHESKEDKKGKGKGGAGRRPQHSKEGEDGEARPPKRAKLADTNERVSSHDGRGDKGGRKKPGAALAGAPREQAGIVESTGKKIVF